MSETQQTRHKLTDFDPKEWAAYCFGPSPSIVAQPRRGESSAQPSSEESKRPTSHQPPRIVRQRPRFWVWAIAPWVIVLLVCSVCAAPASPFALHRQRRAYRRASLLAGARNLQGFLISWALVRWRRLIQGKLVPWIQNVLSPCIRRLWQSSPKAWKIVLKVATFILSPVLALVGFAIARRGAILEVIRAFWSILWPAILGIAVEACLVWFWKSFQPKQRLHRAMLSLKTLFIDPVTKKMAEGLYKAALASKLWSGSRNSSTAVQSTTAFRTSPKRRQRSQKAVSELRASTSEQPLPTEDFLRPALTIGMILICVVPFLIWIYTPADLNPWLR